MSAEHLVGLALVAGLIAAYAVVSDRLRDLQVSGAMVFVGIGLLVGPSGTDLVELQVGNEAIGLLAELTLALVLFADASRINVRALRRQAVLPIRLLGVGLPLTILAGALVAWGLFDLGLAEAALIGAILAPTDAALGQAVVTDPDVPGRVRQTLNVESGLNDGLVAPVVAVLLALVAGQDATQGDVAAQDRWSWLAYAGEQVGYGAAVGVGVGVVAVVVIRQATARDWTSGSARGLAVLAFAVLAWALAGAVGGNGFIAAFVAGLVAGSLTHDIGSGLSDFLDSEGELLSLLVWMIFGGAIVGPMLGDLTWRTAAYSLASLTLVRMVPVALALVGTGLRRDTVALLGWFGPRGLASIVYGVAAVSVLGENDTSRILLVTVGGTVLLSVLAHGVSARPLTRAYAARAQRLSHQDTGGSSAPELQAAPELPTRPAAKHAHRRR